MNCQYDILLSESAARFYEYTAQQAIRGTQDGNRAKYSVAVLSLIDQAIQEISLAPQSEQYSLAGTFSGFYRYCVGQLRVVYTVHLESGLIVVCSICWVSKSLTNFVHEAFESGELDHLIDILGIDKNNMEELPRTPYVN